MLSGTTRKINNLICVLEAVLEFNLLCFIMNIDLLFLNACKDLLAIHTPLLCPVL